MAQPSRIPESSLVPPLVWRIGRTLLWGLGVAVWASCSHHQGYEFALETERTPEASQVLQSVEGTWNFKGLPTRTSSPSGLDHGTRTPESLFPTRRRLFLHHTDGHVSLQGAATPVLSAPLSNASKPTFPTRVDVRFPEELSSGIQLHTEGTDPRRSAPGRLKMRPLGSTGVASRSMAEGYIVYASPWVGVQAIYNPHATGFEEYLHIASAEDLARIRFEVALDGSLTSLRVDNSGHGLEVLDGEGQVRLRAPMPEGIDGSGKAIQGRFRLRALEHRRWAVHVELLTQPSRYPLLLDPSWTDTSNLATERADHSATLLANGKVLIAGGRNALGPLASLELFDPDTGTFGAAGSLATARTNHSATLLSNGTVLVAGGSDGTGSPLATSEIFDPAPAAGSSSVRSGPTMKTARFSHSATALTDGRVLVAGGIGTAATGLSALASAEAFSSGGTGSFSDLPAMSTERAYHTATRLADGSVLLAAGQKASGDALASTVRFLPGSNSFVTGPSLTNARFNHTAEALSDGRVLFLGGGSAGSGIASAELYSPAGSGTVSTFSPSNIPYPRLANTMTRLGSGVVLVTGGYDKQNETPCSYIYTAAASANGSFATTVTLSHARARHTATLLANGQVLVVGGVDQYGATYLKSAERFDPNAAGNGPASCDYSTSTGCSGHGTLSPSGTTCSCNTGYVGSYCEFSDATTCNGHGTVSPEGQCTCAPGFAIPNCKTCQFEYAGALCQYSRDTTCNKLGVPKDDGTCTCDDGAFGTHCEYTNATTCSGRGTVSPSGVCTCQSGYKGNACQYSDAETCNGHGAATDQGTCSCFGFFAGPHCEYSDVVNCNAHGQAQNDGTCICDPGYGGATCTLTATGTCNGHGTPKADGTCTCAAGFAPPNCASCASGYVGTACQFSSATCSGHGTPDANGVCTCTSPYFGTDCSLNDATAYCNNHGTGQANGSCICNSGYVGDRCEYSEATTCNGHGAVAPLTGVCTCAQGFSGASCNQCATGYGGYPLCAVCGGDSTCSGHGTCTSGTCTCTTGYTGPACQYSATGSCNGHGTPSASGTCTCTGFYAGAACETCVAGRAGPNCEYTDATTCSGHGTALYSGACLCSSDYKGPHCEYTDLAQCAGHGAVDDNGQCTCAMGYGGASCNSCSPGFFGYPTCLYCEAYAMCSGHGSCSSSGSCACDAGFNGVNCQYSSLATCHGGGTVNGSGVCTCFDGYAGSTCLYSDAVTCNGRGKALSNGQCQCTTGFTGASCTACAGGFAGPTCQYSDAATCNGHGSAQPDGSCICTAPYFGTHCESNDSSTFCNGHGTAQPNGICACTDGFLGSNCQFSNTTTCNDHGIASDTGLCTCDSKYVGTTCDACATGFSGYPFCAVCGGDATCSGHGTCASGTCTCASGYSGDRCQYSSSANCSGHGTSNSSGGCTCTTGFAGANCAVCAIGYAGTTCQYSRAVTCNDHGTVSETGVCTCDFGYLGDHCQYSNLASCNAHGAVDTFGQCVCNQGFEGSTCNTCKANHYAYPACTYCEAATACQGHGTCTPTGSCSCATGFEGPNCQFSRASTCQSHGTPDSDGLCTCDPGFGGLACGECAPGYTGYPACTSPFVGDGGGYVGLDGSTFDATTGFDAGFPPSWDAAVPDAFVPWFDAGGSNTGTDASGPPLPWDASIPFDTDAGLPDGAPATDASVDAGLTFDAAIFDAAILDANLSDAMVLPPGLDASPPSDASLVTDAAPPNDGAGNDNADAASSSDGASGMSDGSSTTPDATGPVNPTPDASGPPGSDASGGNGPVAPFDPNADLPPGAALDGSTDGSGSTSRPTPDPIRTDPNGTIPSTSSSGAAPRSKSGCTAAPASLGDANGSTLVVMSLLLPLLRRGRRREP